MDLKTQQKIVRINAHINKLNVALAILAAFLITVAIFS